MSPRFARILASLNNSQFQKENNALYQAIKQILEGVGGFEDEFNALINASTGGGGGGAIPLPSPTVEALDYTSEDSGVSLEYSRGDHVHEIDIHPFLLG